MWRRLLSSSKSLSRITERRSLSRSSTPILTRTSSPSQSAPSAQSFPGTSSRFSPDKNSKKKVEDAMPIATGHEREELQAELEGRNILEMNYPVGPFGTTESPAIVKSIYDKRIVGCPGGEGEDEHDVVWFWLEKGKPHECPVCSQYFKLEVVGPGGSPDGHGDDSH